MAGLVDAGEGQVAVLPHLAAGVSGVGADGGVAGGGEGFRGGVGDCEGDEFAAVPVCIMMRLVMWTDCWMMTV